MPESITPLAPLALGTLVHLCIKASGVELDAKGWHIIGVYFSGLITLFCHAFFISGLDLPSSAWQTFLTATYFNVGLYSSIAIGRLLRLRNFPGPIPARLSQFYALSLTAKNNQFHLEVDKLHRQYGDFVRIGPRHISINRASAIPLVYGPPSKCPKGPWSQEVQKNRRRAWDRGFSVKAVASYEDRVMSKTARLIEQLRNRVGEPVNITAWANTYALDIIGDVGLGTEFRSLDDGKDHPAIKGVHDSMAIIGFLSSVPWLLKILSDTPGATRKFNLFKEYCGNQVVLKEKASTFHEHILELQTNKTPFKTLDRKHEPTDLLSWLLKARYENDRSAPPGKIALDEDARLIIIAGSDTTAAAVANAVYYLAQDRRVLTKLQSILDAAFPNGSADWSYAEAKNITYVDHIINETLRLRPPVPSGLSRTTPPEGLQIDDVYIPGNTVVSIAAHTIQRDPRYYEDPEAFYPERWEGMSPETAPFLAFSRGATNCAGKQFARMEMRASLSQIALNFDMHLADDGTPAYFDKNQRDTFTLTLPPLNAVFKARVPGQSPSEK
ncbi:Cytochrome p450 [Lasiodiplodia theobromae]|uniref:Cytochrome p450 n=1 Tax=Lasiodiplodia theobromae TaxID=45133 RepID=UPI0015C3620C|nr:Cytochrome p450 [Lasiodiplodia theobromae]KAF4541054.1 Cytochrome p450 [Lasiodiplodia theobromae]